MDQHEASYKVGLLLKETYIDNTLNTNEEKEKESTTSLSWKDYKTQKNI